MGKRCFLCFDWGLIYYFSEDCFLVIVMLFYAILVFGECGLAVYQQLQDLCVNLKLGSIIKCKFLQSCKS